MMEATLTATPVVDSPLLDQVRGALSKSHGLSPRHVQIETRGGKVRLAGTVGSFYQKQMAQEIVRRVDGVETVENQLQVSW
ncbi:MAG: BON domain-containing protein [Planctomycetota bacterium]